MTSPHGSIVIFGGRSEIGVEVARRLAPGRTVILAARRADDLHEPRDAVLGAGAAAVHTVEFDADDLDTHQGLLDRITGEHGPIEPGTYAKILSRVVFSSVAGVRVRRANYVYGSAKAGLDGFASGLSDALRGSGVSLLLVRPGFVIGRMAAGMTAAPLPSTPGQVADATVRALRRGRTEVAVPGLLRPVFAVMPLVPRAVWRRLPR